MADRNPDPAIVIMNHIALVSGYYNASEMAAEHETALSDLSEEALGIIDALESAGLRIVSLEPTEEMIEAHYNCHSGIYGFAALRVGLRAALAAAPQYGGQTDQ